MSISRRRRLPVARVSWILSFLPLQLFFFRRISAISVRVPAAESRIIPSRRSLEASTDVRRLSYWDHALAFTCIQGAPLVVIKLSRMTDLPARLSGSRRILRYIRRPCERPVARQRALTILRKLDRTRALGVCSARQVAITRSEIQRIADVIYVSFAISSGRPRASRYLV